MKRILCIFLSIMFLIPFAVSCAKEQIEESKPQFIEDYDFIVKFGKTEIVAKQINSSPVDNNIVVYTRDYKINGEYSMTLSEAQEGRVAFSIVRDETDRGVEYSIAQKLDESIENAIIPVNGFVITVPKTVLEGVRANEGQMVKVEGYEKAVSAHERHDLATFSPDYLIAATRRIYLKNPADDFKADKIYFIDNDMSQSKKIAVDNITVVLEKSTSTSYTVKSFGKESEIKIPSAKEALLVFTGDYNIAYANQYFATAERISLSMIDKANSYSDMPAIITANGKIEFGEKNYNVTSIAADGIYVFDNKFSADVTPETDKKRVDVVIVDGIVASISNENERTLIPDGNGLVISFVGDNAIKSVSEFVIGDAINSFYIEFYDLPNSYVEINGCYFAIDKVNFERVPSGVTALYTSEYGTSTGTNEYGAEIIIENDKVTKISTIKGNSDIPENGYVLSIHKDSENMAYVSKVKVGDKVAFSLTGGAYDIHSLVFDDINAVRGEDMLILYRSLSSTATNGYGFEIAVDKDGCVVDAGYSGNIKIPKGGFVLSGHGKNKVALEEAYAIGEKVYVDYDTNEVLLIKTPDLKLKAAQYSFATVSDLLDKAKSAYLNIEYKNLSDEFEHLSELISDAEKAFKAYEFDKAFTYANTVVTSCEMLEYSMIESKAVENRAVWYRSNETSDEQVRATINKMKQLNVNALYIETWYEGYCIGNKVQVAGYDLSRSDYDVLEAFIRIGHENGIEVHAWVQNFFVGYYYVDGPKYYNPVFTEEKFHDKYLIDRGGNKHFYYVANNNYWYFLNPNDRECRDLVLAIYKELITKYDLDGLHLDYIRFPELNMINGEQYDFGYNQDIIDGFAKATGITQDPRTFIEGTDYFNKWNQYRCDIITSFAGEVYDMVKEVNDDIWLSAATYPDIKYFKKTIMQDVVSFVENGYFDEIFSMSYGVDNAYVLSTVEDYTSVTNNNTFYSSGIAAFLETTQKNFAYQLTEVEQAGADGVAIFALGSIAPNTYQYQIMYGAFRKPSVQVTKLSLTASAQMQYICEKADNISYICTELTQQDFEFIKSQCDTIKSFSDSFNVDTASASEKIKWCNDTLELISNAKGDILETCGDNKETQSIIEEFEDLEYWLNISIKRLND